MTSPTRTPESYIPWRERPALRHGDIASLLGVSLSTLYRAIRRHKLQPNRSLGVTLFPMSEVLRLFAALGLDEELQTPWMELDDVFYEARGQTWALIQLLRAAEVDFREVLEDKNARVSVQQLIRELEPTQDPMWSPVILNGTGFGMLANHSLVMASYISRANAAIIDLRRLLSQG